MEKTIYGKLKAFKSGIYYVYVFETPNKEYIMCTKLPNWGDYDISIGDTGYLTYQEAISGDEYVDRSSGEIKKYRFSNVYFKDFVKDNKIDNDIIL